MRTKIKKIDFHKFPDKFGRFGKFGGRFVAETLMPLLLEVESEYKKAKKSKNFRNQLDYYFKNYIGRPSPLYFAERLSKKLNNSKIYFKRDELNHTGAHKINNCIGQICNETSGCIGFRRHSFYECNFGMRFQYNKVS